MSKRKVNQLTDVVVEKVGLVSLGANQETFFLLKSVEEESNMNEVQQEVAQEEVSLEPVINEDSIAAKVVSGIKKLLGADKPEEVEVEAEAEQVEAEHGDLELEEGEPELLAEEEVEKSADTEQKVEVAIADPANEVIEKVDALEKANLALLERLQKAEQALLEKSEAVEKQEFIAKAADFRCVPVAQDALAEQLYKLHKADGELFGFWSGLLTAMDKSLSDAGLFSEVGTTQQEVSDKEELIKIATESGNFEELKKLMLGLSAEDAQKVIEGRRAVKKSRTR